MIGLRLLAVLALVAVNGFFAAAEFSLVAVRVSRVRQLIEQGDARARVVQELLSQLDRVVSGVQVGVTLASLGLGALGESTLAQILRPMLAWLPGSRTAILAHGAALALAFALLTMMHVVLGELVPKTISLERAGQASLVIARPFYWYLNAFRPAIDLLDGMSRALHEEVQFDTEKVSSVDWISHPTLRHADAPEKIDVVLVNGDPNPNRPDLPSYGAGEASCRPMIAAVANAIYDATGVRIRRVPFRDERVLAALKATRA